VMFPPVREALDESRPTRLRRVWSRVTSRNTCYDGFWPLHEIIRCGLSVRSAALLRLPAVDRTVGMDPLLSVAMTTGHSCAMICGD
jgi:hypothetical protein